MKFLSILAFLIACVAVALHFVLPEEAHTKVGYVNISTLFNEFEMTGEMKEELYDFQQVGQEKIDKMRLDYMAYSQMGSASPDGTKRYQMQLQQLTQELAEKNEQYDTEYTNKVHAELNKLVGQYSEEQEFDLLFGNSGEGFIMAGKDDFDVTDEVLIYVNENYEKSAEAQ